MEKVGVTMNKEEMEEEKSNHSPFEKLSSETVWNILLFLPTKACLNCKLVCKGWNAIITNPKFADERHDHGIYFSLLLQGSFYERKKEYLLLDLDQSSKVDDKGNLFVTDDAALRFKPTLPYKIGELQFVNECNGLICLMTHGLWSPFIICNLLTAQHVSFNQPYKKSYRVDCCGLGYSPESGQFKVIRMLKPRTGSGIAEVCTLGTNVWRSVGNVPGLPGFGQSKVLLKNSLHWYTPENIFSFNFETEEFLPVPLSDEMKSLQINGVSILNSWLCCKTENILDDSCEVWVMKEYGKQDSWVKRFHLKDSSWDVMPFLEMDSGEFVISYPKHYRGLYVYDPESGRSKGLYFCGNSRFSSLACRCNTKFSKFEISNTCMTNNRRLSNVSLCP